MGWKSLAACATVVAATLAPTYAQADQKPKPPPTPPGEPATADCTLGAGEWKRCLAVDATLNHAPKVGQRAVLTVRVRASADLDDVDVSFALPQMLELKKAPHGFTTKPGRGGAVRTAAGTVDLRAGDELRFKAHVGAVAEGEHSISVAAVTGRGFPYDSETVYAPLIVGSTPQTSQLGYREGVQRAARTSAPVVRTKAPYVASQPVARSKQQYDGKRRAGIQAVSCVRGRFVYREGGQERPAKNLEAQAWDEDSISDDQLGVDLLDGDGRFEVCFENDDGLGGGGQDLYLRFATKHARFTVTHENGDEWIFRPPRRDDDIADGETIDFGTWHPANPDHDRALITFDAADNADVWTPGRCWDRDESDCRNFEIRWPDNASQYTWDDTVHITNDDGRDRWVVTHEIGHAVMDNVYQDFRPDSGPDCLDHGIWSTETATCAWVEGFADWYAWTVRRDPNWGALNVENQVWGDRVGPNPSDALRPTGDHVEGRIAGALWDLQDAGEPAATAYWDHWNEGSPFPVWETFLDHRSSSFDEFWRQRRADGFSAGDEPAGALYQNTIDKDFRNPLDDGVSKRIRNPEPPGQHNYRFANSKLFWSVVAVRPPAGADYEVDLYDDRAMTQRLRTSNNGPGQVDFVAVDSNQNHQPVGDFYPRVRRATGDGDYDIEADYDSARLLGVGTEVVLMGERNIVHVWDLCTPEKRTITVTPGSGTQDPELFVMTSTPGPGGNSVKSRVDAFRTSTTGGLGQAESVEIPAAPLTCYGVVLVNRSGGGSYTVNVS